jgi:prevent-host-death family protein
MKTQKALYKRPLKKRVLAEGEVSSGSLVLREVATLPEIGPAISVRAAKAHLSALLELVAGGSQITITSDGEPKAVLSPVAKNKPRKVFTGMGDYLLKQPIHPGSAQEAVDWSRGKW